jgi:hypothetical protein
MTAGCRSIAPARPDAAIESLVLPEPGEPVADCRGCDQPVAAEHALLDGREAEVLRSPADPHERARYRWTVGHQAMFCVWRHLRDSLEALAAASPQEDIDWAATGYEVGAVLFLYSGGCTREEYEATVRRDMAGHHPAFSGEWARDHIGLPRLLRSILDGQPAQRTERLARAARANRDAHMAVASRLVPGGGSLLQKAGRRPGTAASAAELDLHDEFFTVRRAAVCDGALNAQLTRRLAQIAADLSAHGMPEPPPDRSDDLAPLLERVPDLFNDYLRPLRPTT